MNRWYLAIMGLFCAILLTGCAGKKASQTEPRPNIILIMADDLGYSDLAIHGNTLVETPNLDRFASESAQFSQFYVTPVCATTRASLLTGRHFLRTGVSHVHGGKDFLHLEEVTMAESIRSAGYVTGMWGKWHSGKTPGYFPWERGFDEAYMARLYQYQDNEGLYNGDPKKTKGWVTEVLTDMAIDFIRRNREQPFFAYIPYLTCHAPLKAPEEYVDKYLDKGLSPNLSTLYGMVDHMDYHLGRLLDTLDELQLSERTIILFLSDNGPAIINNYLTDEDRRIRYVNGLRGHKGNIWENGIRSPLLVRWKGSFSPATIEQLADVTDLYPTLLELAGVKEIVNRDSLDGRSIVPFLKGERESRPDKEIFLYANPGWPPTDLPWTPEGVKDEYRPWKYSGGDNLSYENQILGVRGEQYKLLMNPGPTDGIIGPGESGYVLVDLKNDPREQNNLVQDRPEVFKRMEVSLMKWHQSVYHSKNAFEMPVYQVGKEKSGAYPVLAYGPVSTSPGVKGASNYITCFTQPGDSAAYTINVKETGLYTVEIRYALDGSRARQFALAFSEETYPIELIPGNDPVYINNVRLSEGIAILRLFNRTANEDGSLRLFEMLIRHQEDTPEV